MKYAHLHSFLGEEKFALLKGKTVTVIGLGGMGSTLAEMLVRSGIDIRIIEKGRVELEDLDRLSLFGEPDLSKFKATQAKKILGKINASVTVKSFNEDLTEDTMFLLDADVIVDCSGNEELHEPISKYAFKKGIPCIMGAIRDTKCIVIASTDKKGVHDQTKGLDLEQTEGILPSAPHMVAGFAYNKVVKFLVGEKLKRGVVVYDVWDQQFEDKKGKKK